MNVSKRGGHMSLSTRLLLSVTIAVVLGACVTTSDKPPDTPQQKEKKRSDAAQFNVQLGIAYLHQGNIQLAKEKLDRAMKEGPQDPAVHSAMALLYDQMNKPAQADEEFRTALRLSPRDPDIVNNYAVYLCRTGRTDEGVKYFMDAAHNALYSTPAAAYTNAGVCLRSANRYEQAVEQFQKALAVRPNFAEAAFQLIDTDFTRGRVKDARAQLDRYLSAFDATPDLLLIGVKVARAQGDRLSAERFSRRLRVDFPSSDQARLLLELDRNPG
jgi:type IV pilus assembly protein PilF